MLTFKAVNARRPSTHLYIVYRAQKKLNNRLSRPLFSPLNRLLSDPFILSMPTRHERFALNTQADPVEEALVSIPPSTQV
jgi:hypothetical protein